MQKSLYPVLIVVLAAVSITAGLVPTVSAQLPPEPKGPPTCPTGSAQHDNGNPMSIKCWADAQCPEGISSAYDKTGQPTCVLTNPPRPTCPAGFTLDPGFSGDIDPAGYAQYGAAGCFLDIQRRIGF
jgi:hypothetical protein